MEAVGFKFNPYDPCVANRTTKGSQHTLLFHVDDLKSSLIDPRANDEFDKWLQKNYGEHGEVSIHRGKIHRSPWAYNPGHYEPFSINLVIWRK